MELLIRVLFVIALLNLTCSPEESVGHREVYSFNSEVENKKLDEDVIELADSSSDSGESWMRSKNGKSHHGCQDEMRELCRGVEAMVEEGLFRRDHFVMMCRTLGIYEFICED
jgi:hypothetical protein